MEPTSEPRTIKQPIDAPVSFSGQSRVLSFPPLPISCVAPLSRFLLHFCIVTGECVERLNCLNPSHSFMEMDPSWELMSLLEELNGSVMEIPAVNENYLFHQAELCVPFPDHLSGSLSAICQTPIPQPQAVACRAGQSQGDRDRKDIEAPDASNEHSPVAPPETRLTEVKMKSNKNVCSAKVFVVISYSS